MDFFTEDDETQVRNAVAATFPGYCVSFMEDPDDPSVVFVRLYDVAESDIETFKQRLRRVLRENVCVAKVDLIPSIVSSKNTHLHYSQYLRHRPADEELDIIEKYRKALVAVVQLEREMNESINKAGYSTGGEAGHYFYKAVKVAKEALKS